MSTEDRVASLERSFVTLTRLMEGASERADTHQTWINQLGSAQAALTTAQAETEVKIAALVDAQIRGEDNVSRLTTLVAALTAAQARTDAQVEQLAAHVDKLADTLERYIAQGRNGQG